MAQRTSPPALPGFTFIKWLGGGGFADVFRYQDGLGRRVAVKVLHRGVDSGATTDFEAEANLMAKLSNHPNIVSIFQAGVADDGRPFLVMEECQTEHLGARIAKRTQTTSKAMEVAIQVAGAVETSHRMGILHRDIKPANILFTEFQRPALTDFGISASGTSVATNALSPSWAPQEQYPDLGLPMGPWSDVFSLAATMWAMLVGHSPLEIPGGPNDRLSLRHRARTFVPPRTGRLDVPAMLEGVLATALARDPGQRYQSALEFARAIQGVQGQLNESVTPIDVLSEQVDEDHEEVENEGTGTRISGFMLIDPEAAPHADLTAASTGPSGGITAPHDHSSPGHDFTPDPFPSTPVAQHGRGYATPGLRDFTGPAIPERVEHTVIDGGHPVPGQEAPRPPARSGLTRSLVVGGVVVLAGAALAALWFSGALSGTATTDTPTSAPPTVAHDPLSTRVPPVEDLLATKDGQTVTFTWTNPDPKPGDKYLVDQISTPAEEPTDTVSETTVAVPMQPGQTCVEVRLRRGNGNVSEPAKACEQS